MTLEELLVKKLVEKKLLNEEDAKKLAPLVFECLDEAVKEVPQLFTI